MSAAASGGAAAAAAAARARREHEEEEMSGYTPDELADGWEFKILRSATGAFRRPERLREALAEEAKAGWVLVEKFDTQRLRLKRPASARERDAGLGFDPYRTSYGVGEGKMAVMIVLSIFGVLALVAGIAVALKMRLGP